MSELVSNLKFQDLCNILEVISSTKQPKEKKAILFNFIEQFRSCDASFFSILRLILPQLERDRSAFGVKEFSLAKKIIKLLSLSPDGPDATCLLKFQANSKNKKIKDFADAAFWILNKYFHKSCNLTIADINNYLDTLALKHSSNDPRGFDETLFKIFRTTCAKEQKWLIRIILKELKLGIGQETILNTYHPDGAEFYASNSSLSRVCQVLKDHSKKLHEIEIEIFTPFRAMLSKQCNVKEFLKVTSADILYYVETKFDGERFQLHMKNNVFKYFSRRGFEYTDTYGDSYDNGLFTPLLRNAFNADVKSIILDGEMMGWNIKTKSFGSKGMNFDVKNLKATTTHQPCFCVFDILLFNDQILTNKPLRQRLSILNKCIRPIEGVIMLSKTDEAKSQKDLIDALNQTMDKGEEGIIFKNPNSIYKMNTRDAGWWKMKLEYFENVMSDLDVIILGGFYGSGRHRLNIRIYLTGVAVANPKGTPNKFLAFVKIKTGLSDDEYKILDDKLDPHWKKMTEGDPTKCGIVFGKEKPDVWVAPENSCILLVRGSELTKTSEYPSDYTLRFPRILSIRDDKAYYDCLTDKELNELTSGAKHVEKLSKRHLELEDLQIAVKKQKKKLVIQPVDFKNIAVKNTILDSKEFRVLTGNEKYLKKEIENLIIENGGDVVQNEGENTFCIIAGYNDTRIEFYKEKEHYCDVVKLDWLLNVIKMGSFKSYEPFDILASSNKTNVMLEENYDEYFDSYTEEATVESVKKCISIIKEKKHYINLMPEEIEDLLSEMANFKK